MEIRTGAKKVDPIRSVSNPEWVITLVRASRRPVRDGTGQPRRTTVRLRTSMRREPDPAKGESSWRYVLWKEVPGVLPVGKVLGQQIILRWTRTGRHYGTEDPGLAPLYDSH